ncbi:AhpC/TSA family protein [Hymenobacter sp. BT664]|uniref:AhpC/TSA family protein n=1 Tax=Hymenobacter montanus TaxID=2771359 RepID=A0A927BFV1_9BACT|nr:TlpA disulfide reductase family protein [Hymenobacter montanus]MBD2769153.1 AhpC/TSA family protein [Hymenobacter montanus]
MVRLLHSFLTFAFAFTVLVPNQACQNTAAIDGYTISGQLSHAPAGTPVYLAQLNDGKVVEKDTGKTDEQGRFTLQGQAPTPGLYQISLHDDNRILVVLTNKTHLRLRGDARDLISSYSVQGSPESDLVRQMTGMMLDTSRRMEQKIASIKHLIRRNATSAAAGFIACNQLFFDPEQDIQFTDSIALIQQKAHPELPFYRQLQAKRALLQPTAIGNTAPDIEELLPNGKRAALRELRGKYVLVDFWASWCGPCRQQSPELVKAYDKFKDQGPGFTVYSVSLDQNRDRWIKAIAEDKLHWPTHVSDLKGFNSVPAATYGVRDIPQSFLLDPQGHILAKNLSSDSLMAKLAEVLK